MAAHRPLCTSSATHGTPVFRPRYSFTAARPLDSRSHSLDLTDRRRSHASRQHPQPPAHSFGKWWLGDRSLKAPALCPSDEDLLVQFSSARRSWAKPKTRPWMAELQNRFVGAGFARSLGVRTPRIFFCGLLSDLPEVWPAEWGTDFVCKPQWGASSMGVLVLRRGVEVGTS